MLKLERKQNILDSAEELFAQKGYHATSIADIIQQAGIARGTFYLYFSNKKAIFDTLLDNLLDSLDNAIKRIDVKNPLVEIKANLMRASTILIEKKNLTKILFAYSSGVDAEFEQKLADFYNKLFGLIESALVLGIEMKIIRTCNPKIVASCILGIVKEVTYALISSHYRVNSIEETVDEMIQLTLKGLIIT